MQFCCANTAERIEILLGVETLGETTVVILDDNASFPRRFDAVFAKLLWPFVCIKWGSVPEHDLRIGRLALEPASALTVATVKNLANAAVPTKK